MPAHPTQDRIEVIYKSVVSFTILVSILLIIGIRHAGSDPLFACGLFGSFIIYLGSRPSLKHAGLAILAGVILEFLYSAFGGPFGPFSPETLSYIRKEHGFVTVLEEIECVGAFFGIGAIFVMALDKVWTGTSRFVSVLGDSLLLPGFSLFVGLVLQLAVKGSHQSFDYMLYRFDSSLGLAPGRFAADLFRKVPWMGTAAHQIYVDLLIFPEIFYAWGRYKSVATRIHLLQAYLVVGFGGLLYMICPAMGPIYAFGHRFPDALPALAAVPAATFLGAGLFNAMPSLHMAWALLVWVAAWELGSVAVSLASLVVVFTGLATVGSGEHYFIDLVVSAPLVMMVYGICLRRQAWTAAGLAMVASWALLLRAGIQLPMTLDWALVTVTLATTAFMMRSLFTTRLASNSSPVPVPAEPLMPEPENVLG